MCAAHPPDGGWGPKPGVIQNRSSSDAKVSARKDYYSTARSLENERLIAPDAGPKRRCQHILRSVSSGPSMLRTMRRDTWLFYISVAWTAIIFVALIYVAFVV